MLDEAEHESVRTEEREDCPPVGEGNVQPDDLGGGQHLCSLPGRDQEIDEGERAYVWRELDVALEAHLARAGLALQVHGEARDGEPG